MNSVNLVYPVDGKVMRKLWLHFWFSYRRLFFEISNELLYNLWRNYALWKHAPCL